MNNVCVCIFYLWIQGKLGREGLVAQEFSQGSKSYTLQCASAEMAQQVKTLYSKPDSTNSISRIHMVEGKKLLL